MKLSLYLQLLDCGDVRQEGQRRNGNGSKTRKQEVPNYSFIKYMKKIVMMNNSNLVIFIPNKITHSSRKDEREVNKVPHSARPQTMNYES